MAFQSFEDLKVWKSSCALAVRTYELLRESKDYDLKDQMQRAAVSVASNIEEGSEQSSKNFRRYLHIARGSAAELRTQTYIAAKIGTIVTTDMTAITRELKEISAMLTGLANSLHTEN